MVDYQHTATDLPEENEYPKLVRDLIPDIIKREDGYDALVRVLQPEEFEEYLRTKVVEEASELCSAETDHNLAEEIADVRELLDTLQRLKGFSEMQIRVIQDEKRAKRGGFDKRLLMLNNDRPAAS